MASDRDKDRMRGDAGGTGTMGWSTPSYMGTEGVLVKNIPGSTAGAGSGEFHQYRQLRRKEMFRLQKMEQEAKKAEEAEQFEKRQAERMEKSNAKTLKKAEKRKKRKEKMKVKDNKLARVQQDGEGKERKILESDHISDEKIGEQVKTLEYSNDHCNNNNNNRDKGEKDNNNNPSNDGENSS
jgi:ATPase subunit of ABC transporter with duplicated ATPase domains